MLTGCSSAPADLVVALPAPLELTVAPPEMACREGWSLETYQGHAVCNPFPGGPATCSGAERQRLGGLGCEPLATCPTDGWPADVPPDAVYVRPGATGNGTRMAPFGTIDQALASSAGPIVLSTGTHPFSASLADREILGACAAETRIVGSAGPAITATGGTVLLADLEIGAPQHAALRVESGHLRLERALIAGFTGTGVWIGSGATAELTDVIVTDAAPDGDATPYGVRLDAGGHLVGTGLTMRTLPGGLALEGTATLEDVLLRDVTERGLATSADVTARGVVAERGGTPVLNVSGDLHIEDLVVHGVRWDLDASTPLRGVQVQDGLQITRAWIHDCTSCIVGARGTLHATDAVVDGGIMLGFDQPVEVHVERSVLLVADNDNCVFLANQDATLTLTDVTCERYAPTPARDGPLLQALAGTLRLQRFHLRDTGAVAPWIELASSHMVITDALLEGMGSGTAFVGGYAAATLDLSNVEIRRVGVLFDMVATHLSATDVRATDIIARVGALGTGDTTFTRVAIEGADALLLDGALQVQDVDLVRTSLQCGVGCDLTGSGLVLHDAPDVGVFSEGRIDLERLHVDGVIGDDGIGIHSRGPYADLILQDARVEGAAIPLLDEGARALLRNVDIVR